MDFWTRPVGCGPYRHVRTVPQTMMELEANPDYFRGQPQIERVVLKFGQSNSVLELLSGSVDAVSGPALEDISNISLDRRFRALQQVMEGGYALWWNLRHPLFEDIHVRRALTHAINRRELLQVLNFPEDAQPIDFIRSPLQTRRGRFPESNPYDVQLAAELLDEAGWRLGPGKKIRERRGQPFRFKTLVLIGGPTAAVYVQDQLKRIGVSMDIVMMTGQDRSEIIAGDFEAVMANMGDWNLGDFLRGVGYRNPLFFELLGHSQGTFDPEEKERIHNQLTSVFQADVPVTFLHPSTGATIASTRVRGLDGSPWRGDLVQGMEELWLEEEG